MDDMTEDMGVAATPPGHSDEPASSLAADAGSVPNANDFKHCDDYIDDAAQPECLRRFLDYARSPAHGADREGPAPKLFADYQGERVRVVMASRFGDVGITTRLHAEHGYDKRVPVAHLTGFRDKRKRDAMA